MWFNGLRCVDCSLLDLNDRNKYGDAYCPEYRKYVELDSYTCSSFNPNFYVMTAYCTINKIPYNSELMVSLIGFRDNYMSNNEDGISFLEEYETIGPVLAQRLITDVYKIDVVSELEMDYIVPMLDFIKNERLDDAQNTYIQMINSLKNRYGYSKDKTKRL